MNKAEKTEQISGLSEKFSKAKAAFLIDFKGMNVEQVTNLRKKLRSVDSEMKVVRNTLARLALNDHPGIKTALEDSFVGTNAVVFAYGEANEPAKTLADFASDVEHLQLKSGYMDGAKLTGEGVKQLAALPGKDVLRAQLLGLFQAPSQKFVRQLASAPESFARLLAAYRDSKGA